VWQGVRGWPEFFFSLGSSLTKWEGVNFTNSFSGGISVGFFNGVFVWVRRLLRRCFYGFWFFFEELLVEL
jgi:hypothetical protein